MLTAHAFAVLDGRGEIILTAPIDGGPRTLCAGDTLVLTVIVAETYTHIDSKVTDGPQKEVVGLCATCEQPIVEYLCANCRYPGSIG